MLLKKILQLYQSAPSSQFPTVSRNAPQGDGLKKVNNKSRVASTLPNATLSV